jgi:uncharacterized protein (UPF0332 family)
MNNHDEVIALLIKAESKLKTARIDSSSGQYEDSISRSYYCAFLSISALLLSKDLSFSSHNQTIGNFNKEFVKTGIFTKDYTETLQSLFEDRQSSDYDALTTFTEENANEDMRIAEKVLLGVKSYLEIE